MWVPAAESELLVSEVKGCLHTRHGATGERLEGLGGCMRLIGVAFWRRKVLRSYLKAGEANG